MTRVNPRVEQFLKRRLAQKDFIKEYSKKEVLAEIDHICPNYNWGEFPPWKHQAATVLLALCDPRMWMILAMGAGKTYCAIHAVNIRRQIGEIKKPTLVVCPTFVINTWGSEVPKFTPSVIEVLEGTGKGKLTRVRKSHADFIVVNYQGLLAMVSDPHPVKVRGKIVNKRLPNNDVVAELAGRFGCIILDESQAVKNPEASISKVVNSLTDGVPYVYALTGTPFHRPMDLWAQSYIIDKGVTFGETLALFQRAFYDRRPGYWGGFDFTLKPRMGEHLHRRLKNLSIRYEDHEFEDLPPLVEQDVPLTLPPKARKKYTELLKDAQQAEETREVKNVFIRLRQVCGGFIDSHAKDSEMLIRFERPPKVQWLLDFASGLDTGQQVVVFTEFIESAVIISEELKKAKVKHGYMHGANGRKVLAEFQTNPDVTVLLLNSKSGAAGLNLQNACASIFYELPSSVIVYKQALKRVHRSGQTHTVHHYYLNMTNTVEDRIRDALEDGTTLLDRIVDGTGSFA